MEMMDSVTRDQETAKKTLFEVIMKGEWNEVVDIYSSVPTIHKARITRAGDTALHLAVSDGQEDVVRTLLELICSHHQQAQEVLRIKNERGHTALHIAASTGSVRNSQQIAMVDPSLVSIRDYDGETPIFLAALHGHKEAFLCLHDICSLDPSTRYNYNANCRRNDGDTVLHCAIASDYFDLAFHIIHLYEDFVNCANERGYTPLHLLASKPSVFRSGSRLGPFETIIYRCISADKLELAQYGQQPTIGEAKNYHRYPEGYQTCLSLWGLQRKAVRNRIIRGSHQAKMDTNDMEHQRLSLGRSANYKCCFDFLKTLKMLINRGLGCDGLKKLRRKKELHLWSAQILTELLQRTSLYKYDDFEGRVPKTAFQIDGDDEGRAQETPFLIDGADEDVISYDDMKQNNNRELKHAEMRSRETPILVAAKNGVTEIIEKILELFPVAIHDMNAEKKNIVLLAVENRHPDLYQLLLKRKGINRSIFRAVDDEGNSALHLAANFGMLESPWRMPGAALQMQWEIKWYEFVRDSMPNRFFVRYNKRKITPEDIFTETHKELVQRGGEWLDKTSDVCSYVTALIATVAFATSATLPGGFQENSGTPTLEKKPAFMVFAFSSLLALFCSVYSLVMFISIFTSQHQEYDFRKVLPRKLIFGLTSMFLSIASILVSFCAGHYFVIKDKLNCAAFPIYAVASLPLTFFALEQFPLYFNLCGLFSGKYHNTTTGPSQFQT